VAISNTREKCNAFPCYLTDLGMHATKTTRKVRCFTMIEHVLNEIYEEDLINDPDRDQHIRHQLQRFSTPPVNLFHSPNLDERFTVHPADRFHLPNTYDYHLAQRFAYLYQHVTCQANLVAERFTHVPELSQLFETPHPTRMTCLGGGPGSEVFGLLKAASMASHITLPAMHVTLLDSHPEWAESWSTIVSEAHPPFVLNTTYVPWDVFNNSRQYHHFFHSHWFTMVGFLSNLDPKRDQALPALAQLLHHVQPGTQIFYLDNAATPGIDWMIQLAHTHGFSATKHVLSHHSIGFNQEDSSNLAVYRDKFGIPTWTEDIAWGILTKSDPD